ncbi:MAG: hypothetical protein LBQ54_15300 [Planctomycetaceae bacterium]|jgi:TrmH family RNA methyltransferase|nr:hypothetical protein [Planctomycetaceae bacterium]
MKLRTGKNRRKNEQFLIDGVREISRAMNFGIPISTLFLDSAFVTPKKQQENKEFQELMKRTREKHLPVCEVSTPVFLKIVFGNRNEGVVALAEPPDRTLDSLELPRIPMIAVIENIEKPGNLGAIFRSADGAGLNAVIVTPEKTDLFHPHTIRSSLGTVFRPNAAVADAEETIRWLISRKIQIVTAKCDSTKPHTETDFTLPTAIVLGSEAEGLTPRWNRTEICAVKIPMLGIADSLNVSTAAAVLFYEARRQRTG